MENLQKTQNLTIGFTRSMGSCTFSICSNGRFHVWDHPQHTFLMPSLTNPHSPMTYSFNPMNPAELTTICATFMNGLAPLNVPQDSPTPHTPHFFTTLSTSSKRMVTFGGGICKVVIKLSLTVTNDQQFSLLDITETSPHMHTSSTTFGGLTYLPTLHGLSEPVIYVSFAKPIMSSFLQ